jgi:hypothetical protein
MEMALKQYQTAVYKKTWGVESNERREIMNMTAQLVALQQQVSDEQNCSYSNEQWRQKRYDDAPPWMKIPPENLQETRKKVGRFDYIWCPFHRLWQMHKPSECELNPHKKNRNWSKNQNRKVDNGNQQTNRQRYGQRSGTNNDDKKNDANRRPGNQRFRNDKKQNRRVAMQAANNDDELGEESLNDDKEEQDKDNTLIPDFEYSIEEDEWQLLRSNEQCNQQSYQLLKALSDTMYLIIPFICMFT